MEREKSFTFHVYLPENIEGIGQPVVLGGVKELGSWNVPIVKLRQPYPYDPTYWQSDPVTISISNSAEKIHYKHAIYIPKSPVKKETILFEGRGAQDNRTLD